MKKGITLFTVAMAILCAEEANLPLPIVGVNESATQVVLPETSAEAEFNYNRRFIPYVKLGPDLLNVGRSNSFTPNLGVGIRSESNVDAVDMSVSYSSRLRNNAEGELEEEYQAFCPKLLYLRFLNPTVPATFFYGAGGSWGTMENERNVQEFTGLYADLSFGYEKGRDSMIRQIIQCNLTQPVLAYSQQGAWPTPSLELSYSLGF